MKMKALVIIIIGVIVVVIGYSLYNNHQKKISFCKNTCEFIPTTKAWGYPLSLSAFAKLGGEYKFFETQKQCIDYCLNR